MILSLPSQRESLATWLRTHLIGHLAVLQLGYPALELDHIFLLLAETLGPMIQLDLLLCAQIVRK